MDITFFKGNKNRIATCVSIIGIWDVLGDRTFACGGAGQKAGDAPLGWAACFIFFSFMRFIAFSTCGKYLKHEMVK